MKRRALRHAWLVVVSLYAVTASAQSQPAATARPWERDVSAADRRLAEAWFVQGVEYHEQLLRDQAVARYEQALLHWENPKIRRNLVLLMKDMGQYLRAWEHLDAALAWGLEAFDQKDRDRLLAIRRELLQQHLAVVEARCDQPGAEVTLDGKPWFRGPGKARQVVLPGEHVITASQPGYFPMTTNIVLLAGVQAEVPVSMSEVQERRWRPWVPWVVLGSGVAAGIAGTGLDWYAGRQLEQASRELDLGCHDMPRCDSATPRSYDRALWGHRIGTGALVVGGTAAAAGLVLVFLNQPRSYRTEDNGSGGFKLAPLASPDTVGVSAGFDF